MGSEPEIGFHKDVVRKTSLPVRVLIMIGKLILLAVWVMSAFLFTWYFSHTANLNVKGESFESITFTLLLIGFSTVSALPLMHSGTKDKGLYMAASSLIVVFSTAVSSGLVPFNPDKIIAAFQNDVLKLRGDTRIEIDRDLLRARDLERRKLRLRP